MCADSTDNRDTATNENGLAQKLGKYNANDDVYKKCCDATTLHETHPGKMRKIRDRRPGEERILQSELSRTIPEQHGMFSSFGR